MYGVQYIYNIYIYLYLYIERERVTNSSPGKQYFVFLIRSPQRASRWLQDLDKAAADHDWEFGVKGACQLGKAPVVGIQSTNVNTRFLR